MKQRSWLGRLFGKREGGADDGLAVTPAKPRTGTVARPAEEQLPPMPEPRTDVPWEIGTEILKDYWIEGMLGEGGMGTVYLAARRGTDGARFAVKTLLTSALQDDERQRSFLRELRTWIELPESPHLTACRFFRTVGGRLAIFAEYVEGGSLQQWISERRLSSIDQILDVAIQVAWGLEVAHEQGVIHQDVKPANVLMTRDGVAKITDFGLARARRAAGMDEAPMPGTTSFLLSANGMTAAYCSPEQAKWEKLTYQTDIWSYGLLVLELFTGEVTWAHGSVASEALQSYLEGPPPAPFPRMPQGVVEVLRGCFQQEPKRRWSSLGEVAVRLQGVYRQETGRVYPRARPEAESRYVIGGVEHDRRTVGGVKWDDPAYWLKKALRAAGRDESDAEKLIAARTGSRKAQALVDLEVYEEALRLYSSLPPPDRKPIESDLARMLVNKAFVHGSVDDVPGALAMYDQAIAIWERLVKVEGRAELANDLARAYMNKAIAMYDLGDNRGAIAMHDQAIAVWERLVEVEGRAELANDLANGCMNKAIAMYALGDNLGAIAMYDQAIAIRERLMKVDGRAELADDLAVAYMNKANAMRALGDNLGAIALYDQAIAIWERLVKVEGRAELADDLANVYMNKATAMSALGDERGAIAMYDQAIAIRERLVKVEGRAELANNLATTYVLKAVCMSDLGDERGAIAMYDQAIVIRERLVKVEGRAELADGLAMAYMNKANAMSDLGDKRGAIAMYDQAIAIRERLVQQEGRAELADDLAEVYMKKGVAMYVLTDNRGAFGMCEQAIAIRERLVKVEGRNELAGDLAKVKAVQAALLFESGDRLKAEEYAREAIRVLESEVQRTGRSDLKRILDWARADLSGLLGLPATQ
jgi:tetratricopeptide (TPR) repeat protein